MEDTIFNKECSKDYKKRHYWIKLGVVKDKGRFVLIWRCTQCNYCIKEELRFG